MAISKKVQLANGIETSYHIVSLIDSQTSENKTIVYLHSFISKEMYKKAIRREELLAEQLELVKEFDELAVIEEPTKTQKSKLDKLQEKINKLADDINETKEYYEYVANEEILYLPYLENLTLENVQKEIIKTDRFKLATLVA